MSNILQFHIYAQLLQEENTKIYEQDLGPITIEKEEEKQVLKVAFSL
jgi:hypothetical protein